MRFPRRRSLLRECPPSRRSPSFYGRRLKPFSSLVANRWIRSKQSPSSVRFGEHELISCIKVRPNQRVIKGLNVDMDSSANNRLMINSRHLGLEAAFLQWMEDRSLIKFAIYMETQHEYQPATIIKGAGARQWHQGLSSATSMPTSLIN